MAPTQSSFLVLVFLGVAADAVGGVRKAKAPSDCLDPQILAQLEEEKKCTRTNEKTTMTQSGRPYRNDCWAVCLSNVLRNPPKSINYLVCFNSKKLSKMNMTKERCKRYYSDLQWRNYSGNRRDDGSREDSDAGFNDTIHVYSSGFGSHSLYIFFALLIVICSCCGGFFRCRRPQAPELYHYVESVGQLRRGLRVREVGDDQTDVQRQQQQHVMPTPATIPTYEEAVAAADGRHKDESISLPPPPSYEEATKSQESA